MSLKNRDSALTQHMCNTRSWFCRRARDRRSEQGQSGVTLLELLIVGAVSAIVLGGLAGWIFSSVSANNVARRESGTANVASRLNTMIIRDVAGAQFAAVGSGASGPVELADCGVVGPDGPVGAAQTPADVKLALVSPGDRRIVYTLADSPAGEGSALYRRDCPNLKSLALPSDTDPTLNDPVDHFLNQPMDPADMDPNTRSTILAKGVRAVEVSDAEAACPPSASGVATGATADVNCRVVRLVVEIVGQRDPLIFEATRRTDTYCSPECPPVARFTATSLMPAKGDTVTFDAGTSRDPRGNYRPTAAVLISLGEIADASEADAWYAQNPSQRLHYHWNFDTPHTENGVDGVTCRPTLTPDVNVPASNPANPMWAEDPDSRYPVGANGELIPYSETESFSNDGSVVSRTFVTGGACNRYLVTLTVTNASGRSATFSQFIQVAGDPPHAEIRPFSPDFVAMRNKPINFSGVMETFEAPLDASGSYWAFGDSTASNQPLVPAESNLNTTCDAVSMCTASNDLVTHTFTQAGTYFVQLIVQDLTGLRTVATLAVQVEPEYYYASAAMGVDHPDCGAQTDPCREIDYALHYTSLRLRKTDLIVAKGSYQAFDAVQGINVSGGRDDSNGWVLSDTAITVVHGKQGGDPLLRYGVNVSEITGPLLISDLRIEPGDSGSTPLVGVEVRDSSNVLLRKLDVKPGIGLNPTGVLLTESSRATIQNSDIDSGAPAEPPVLNDYGTPDPSDDDHDPQNRSAYGVRVLDGSELTVSGGTVSAQPGRDGVSGRNGRGAESKGCDGTAGVGYTGDGGFDTGVSVPGCTSPGTGTPGTSGGTGGSKGGFFSAGGAGGNGQPFTNYSPQGPRPAGGGGKGGNGGYQATPRPGAGEPGAGGLGATYVASGGSRGSNTFTLANSLWSGPSGGSGSPVPAESSAGNGKAGGGAGGGGGTYSFCGIDLTGYKGASGGGGGGGGKAATGSGAAGSPGWAGGGSFGIYSDNSPVVVTSGATVVAGRGGNGGPGGNGGAGADGGQGGDGAAQCIGGDSSGGGGGGGGAGAGGGGGGAGGPSVAVFHLGDSDTKPSVANAVLAYNGSLSPAPGAVPGAGGTGGLGGSGGKGGHPAGDHGSEAGLDGQKGSVGLDGSGGAAGMACKEFSSSAIEDPGDELSNPCFSSSIVEIVQSPTFVGRTPVNAAPNGSLAWKVVFASPVRNVTAAHFQVVADGLTTGAIAEPIAAGDDGFSSEWYVTVLNVVNPNEANGTVAIRVVSVDGIVDGAGGQIDAPAPFPMTGPKYVVDQWNPSVVSIKRVGAQLVSSTDLQWDITFSEPVRGSNGEEIPVSVFSFSTDGGTIPGANVQSVTKVGPTTYRVTTFHAKSGYGPLRLDISDRNGIVDMAGNVLRSTALGEPYQVDHIPPVVLSIKRHQPTAEITLASTVKWRVEFSEPVDGLTVNNFSLAPTVDGASVTALEPVGVDDIVAYDVTVATGPNTDACEATGCDLLLNVDPVTGIADYAGNPLEGPFNGPVGPNHEKYRIDKTRPTVTIVRSTPPGMYTNRTSWVEWTAEFSEPVTGVDLSLFGVSAEGPTMTDAAVTSLVDGGDGMTFVIRVAFDGASTSGSGAMTLDLIDPGSVADLAGNTMAGAMVKGQKYVVDRLEPATSFTKSAPSEWTNQPVTVTFTPSDQHEAYDGAEAFVSGFGATDDPTMFTTNGSDPTGGSGQVAVGRTATFSDRGVTTVRYASVDRASNWEPPKSMAVKIDQVPPTSGITVEGAADSTANLLIGFAKISFNADDVEGVPGELSGIKEVRYSIDSGSGPVQYGPVSADDLGSFNHLLRVSGEITVEYWAIDNAGNEQAVHGTRTFELDTRGPKILDLEVQPCASGEDFATVFTTLLGMPVNMYVDDGCLSLRANVVQLDPLLPVARVSYHRCATVSAQCEPTSANLIGTVEAGTPEAADGWRVDTVKLGVTGSDAVVERGYTVIVVAEDDPPAGLDSAITINQGKRIGIDLTRPTGYVRPRVNGKS